MPPRSPRPGQRMAAVSNGSVRGTTDPRMFAKIASALAEKTRLCRAPSTRDVECLVASESGLDATRRVPEDETEPRPGPRAAIPSTTRTRCLDRISGASCSPIASIGQTSRVVDRVCKCNKNRWTFSSTPLSLKRPIFCLRFIAWGQRRGCCRDRDAEE